MPADTNTPAATATVDYAFSNRVPQAAQQLHALSQLLDPPTKRVLAEIDIPTGAHVLELGPGNGSIAGYLADRAGPDGRTVVVDREPTQLPAGSTMQIHQHNLQPHGLPAAVTGTFDLIHARLLLVHLPNRLSLLQQLIGRLKPGGWLVIGEFANRPLTPLIYRSPADADLFTKVIDVFRTVLVQQHGADLAWADQLHHSLTTAGLAQVKTIEHAESSTAGDPGCQLHAANITQMVDRLTAAGLTPAELDHFLGLLDDPSFTARSWQLVTTRGRKPHPTG